MTTVPRKFEMQFFRNMKVLDKVPRWMATRDSCKVMTTRWLDINKGDQESLRMTRSTCASSHARKNPYRSMSIDVRRAFFLAKASRPVCIEIPIEDCDGEARVLRPSVQKVTWAPSKNFL